MIGPINSIWTKYEAGQEIANSSSAYAFSKDVEIQAGENTFLTVAEGTPA